jgi:mannan endo-1,4-beta-mannosidase
MMINVRTLRCLLILFVTVQATYAQQLIDKNATKETVALYANLKRLSQKGILFGHQESEAYGVGWKELPGKSDVKLVCGSFAAVHGWDVGNEGQENNVDGVKFSDMLTWMNEAYKRGGINTVSWHVDNPVTGEDAWHKTPVVKDLLPGASGHAAYVKQLGYVADFLAKSKGPVIFRPFHEHNGDWFWWGKGNCTEEEYIQLWRFTVDYLKNTRNLHHLIYAFSPDRSRLNLQDGQKDYLYAYPGDAYVDVIGLDNYMDVGVTWNTKSKDEQRADLVRVLKIVSAVAKEKNKVAALTETGLEGITNSTWFTDAILNPIKINPEIQLAYIMVWRNANTTHHYAPYPGHSSVPDFLKFYNDPYTLFEADIKNLYRADKPLLK